MSGGVESEINDWILRASAPTVSINCSYCSNTGCSWNNRSRSRFLPSYTYERSKVITATSRTSSPTARRTMSWNATSRIKTAFNPVVDLTSINRHPPLDNRSIISARVSSPWCSNEASNSADKLLVSRLVVSQLVNHLFVSDSEQQSAHADIAYRPIHLPRARCRKLLIAKYPYPSLSRARECHSRAVNDIAIPT